MWFINVSDIPQPEVHQVELRFKSTKAEAKALAALKSSWPRGVMTTVGVPVQRCSASSGMLALETKETQLKITITAVSLNGKQT